MRRGFSLLELILVLALIALAAAIIWPSASAAFANFHVERAGDDLVVRIARTRLMAMERGVPYAFTYRVDDDHFWTWACEPLTDSATGAAIPGIPGLGGGTAPGGSTDVYDRRSFELNDKPESREFRFLSVNASEALASMGLSSGVQSETSSGSASNVAGSSLLSRHKLGNVASSARSSAALTIPGLQLGTVTDPIVFEPDGSADKDAIIRIANEENRYVEITVNGLSGAIRSSTAKMVADLAGATTTTTTTKRGGGVRAATRSRETTESGGSK